jgi:hypothetical protein
VAGSLVLALGVAGCGGLVVFTDGGGGGGDSTPPPLSPTCQAAVEAVDWSPCDTVVSYDPRAPFGHYCENTSNVRACAELALAFYGCVAATPSARSASADLGARRCGRHTIPRQPAP